MSAMGMYDSAYWASWHIFHAIMGFVGAMLLCIFGLIFQFRTFTHNNFGVLFFTFWFFSLALTGFGYFLSAMVILLRLYYLQVVWAMSVCVPVCVCECMVYN